jgi:DNA modification methylase
MSNKPSKPDVIMAAVGQLIAYSRNAKLHPPEQVHKIAQQISEMGFLVPIVVDKDMVIISGHGRLQAAKDLNMTEVPVIIADWLTDEQVMAARIADNKVAESAWDMPMLAFDLGTLSRLDIDLGLTGFGTEEVRTILADFLKDAPVPAPEAGKTDENETPAPPEIVRVKRGDLWTLGSHRLLCGDSTSAEDVARLMAGDKADLVFTDPPYNIAYAGGSKKRDEIENDDMGDEDFYSFLHSVYTNAFIYMRPGGVIYVCHADTERVNFTKAFIDAGFHLSSIIIWAKNNATFGRQDYFWKHEPIIYGWHSGGAHQWHGPNNEETIWNIDRPARSEEHPTMKPVQLVERALENSSIKGEIVLDLFGGSGTTLIAAHKTGRSARLMELDPKYAGVILERWARFTEADPVREDGVTWSQLKAEPTT